MAHDEKKRIFKVAPEGDAVVEVDYVDHHKGSTSSEVIFLTHILSLKTAALMHMGIVPNQEDAFDLETAKHIIETLQVLREKSEGNLRAEEKKHLEASIYELQVAFIKVKKNS